MNTNFKDLELNENILTAISLLGYKTPSKIQEKVIPLIINHYDVIGQAQTGTGKTLAYASSILSMLDNKKGVKAIILTPTRELALQVSEEFNTLNKNTKFKVLAVYGGSSIESQLKSLKRGTDIVVGTPGRVMDLIKRKALNLETLDFFVLDEADEMLNMGFLEDIEFIFKKTNEDKQVLLFSATLPKAIEKLAKKYMKDTYEHVSIKEKSQTSINVKQTYYLVNEKMRQESLFRIIDDIDPKLSIIFCQTKKEVDELLTQMLKRNYSAKAMHGDITQSTRQKTLEEFKKGNFKFLIATDVAARGIHVNDIDCVINYKIPQDVESYIHRIGRTGRAKHIGIAISLVNRREVKFLSQVENVAQCQIMKKELPCAEEIVNKRYEKIIEASKEVIDNKEYEECIKFVRDMNKDELIKFSAALLKARAYESLGSDLNKDITVKDTPLKNKKGNTTRVFLTIGKLDKLKRGALLDFLKSTTGIRKENFTNIDIVSKFTFMDVEDDVVDELISKLYNKTLNKRKIRVEIAKSR